jgi:hypothetical protein
VTKEHLLSDSRILITTPGISVFFQIGGLGIFMEEFSGGHTQPFGQLKDIIGGKDDFDIAAAGGETAYSGVTAKTESTVLGQFDRLNIGRVGGFTENGFFFTDCFVDAHEVIPQKKLVQLSGCTMLCILVTQ